MSQVWGYSEDEEKYNGTFATREEAIEEARGGACNGSFWIAQGSVPDASDFVPDADSVVDVMREYAHDSAGGTFAEDWLDGELSITARTAFDGLIRAWADAFLEAPGWYVVEGTPEFFET